MIPDGLPLESLSSSRTFSCLLICSPHDQLYPSPSVRSALLSAYAAIAGGPLTKASVALEVAQGKAPPSAFGMLGAVTPLLLAQGVFAPKIPRSTMKSASLAFSHLSHAHIKMGERPGAQVSLGGDG